MAHDSTRPVWPFKHITTMTAHNRGQWCKKIKGVLRYFGRWDDAQRALQRYLALVQADQHGNAIPTALPSDVSVELAVNHWLTDRNDSMAAGRLTARQFVLYKNLGQVVLETLGRMRTVQSLEPADFKRLRDQFSGGPSWVGSQVRWTRGMFSWTREYYGVSPRYGGQFSAPARAELRRARRVVTLFTPAEIRKLLRQATPALRCFVLLGINCGFGQTDCAQLPTAAVDLVKRLITFDRPKTGVHRVCPLWPETVRALRAYRRPEGGPAELFFVTRWGHPYVSVKAHLDELGQVTKATRTDSVRHEFAMCQRVVAGATRWQAQKSYDHTKGFYSLRHTFRSVAEGCGSPNAIRTIMGHAFAGMDEYYLHLRGGKYEALREVVLGVRRWVFGSKIR